MPVEWLDEHVFSGLGTDEVRLIISGAILVFGGLVYLTAPAIVRRLVRLKRYPVIDQYVGDQLDFLEETIHWPFPTRAVVRLLQLVVFGFVAYILMVVWEFDSQAGFVIDVIFSSLPLALRVLFSLALFVGGFIGTRLLRNWLRQYTSDADHISAHQESMAYRVLQISVFTAVGIAVISLWGVDLTGLLVGAGFLGIVVGMAARQTLGSLIAGLVLMFSRPFEIGHWVEIGDHEGIVTDISIVNTRLRSFNDETIVIPNDTVANRSVVNFSDSQRLRLHLDVGVAYDTDIQHAQSVALSAIEDVDQILRNPKPSVVPTTFRDSSIGLRLRYWIEYPSKPKEWNAHAAVLQAVKEAFDEEGIRIPFPQRTLSGGLETRSTSDDV